MTFNLCVASLSIATAITFALPALAAETAQDFVTKAAIDPAGRGLRKRLHD
ncbi:hypothetical protein [Mesorhizobium sp. INR15]|uniref:hypothetical protein n=1 Tax=Mesorhizobium sp. INR15 TaxID=2654248 RepID=UPI0018966717|nr:hypothetical protein [Mesorhizobium sp. INR15]